MRCCLLVVSDTVAGWLCVGGVTLLWLLGDVVENVYLQLRVVLILVVLCELHRSVLR